MKFFLAAKWANHDRSIETTLEIRAKQTIFSHSFSARIFALNSKFEKTYFSIIFTFFNLFSRKKNRVLSKSPVANSIYGQPTHLIFGTVKYTDIFYCTKNQVRGLCVGGDIVILPYNKLLTKFSKKKIDKLLEFPGK